MADVALGQKMDYIFSVPISDDPTAPFSGLEAVGTRSVTGPFDLDNDGYVEILVTDYSGGGRVHVLENKGKDAWELVYSTPWIVDEAPTSTRYAYGGDLDNDGNQEILFISSTTTPAGFVVYEYTGSDNDYGDSPASVYPLDNPDRFIVEQFVVKDIDADGRQEVLMSNNGFDNTFDKWYIFSVDGEIGSGSEVWKSEAEITSRDIGVDPVYRGGGSPYAIQAADLDGDGQMDLSMHSWNAYNFTNGTVTGPDTYRFPEAGAPNLYYQATFTDDVSLLQGTVMDIDNNGDDEVIYMRYSAGVTGQLSVLNYEAGEDILQVTGEQLVLDVIEEGSYFGFETGDIDGDGYPEIIGTGPPFTAEKLMAREPADYLHVTFFQGGDPEDPANYRTKNLNLFRGIDRGLFDRVHSDSLGQRTVTYHDPRFGRPFAVQAAYLGDADHDGDVEVALAFQGLVDSVNVTRRRWDPVDGEWDSKTRRRAVKIRPFVRIVSFRERPRSRYIAGQSGSGQDVLAPGQAQPSEYGLEDAYPNPFNPVTTFQFSIEAPATVNLSVYDLLGRKVRTLVDRTMDAGRHRVTFEAGDLPSGTYLYRLETPEGSITKRMVLMK